MIQPYTCVVVANGSFPTTELALQLLKKAKVIIACDGAIAALHSLGLPPAAIVGDLDSISEELRILYADRIHTVIDQEINDLTKAISYAREMGYPEVLILGATGLREDHTLGNISLLMDYAALFNRIEMLSDYGLFTPLLHTDTLSSIPGQQVSIFSMHAGGRITSENLRWPIRNRILNAWWEGTLNEALSTDFTLTLNEGASVIVYRLIAHK